MLTNRGRLHNKIWLRTTTLAIKQVRIRDTLYYCVVVPKLGGGRVRRFFRNKGEARSYFELCRTQQQNFGLAAFSLSESLRIEAIECQGKLAAEGHTLRNATAFFLDNLRKVNSSCSIETAAAELLAARKTDGCSKRYLDDLRVRLNRFAADFKDQPLAAISARDIDDWLRALVVCGVTRNSFRRRLSTLFGYAKKRGYAVSNPIEDVERAKEQSPTVGILSPAETQRLLENAQPEMVPFWAIGAFAGLRTIEVQRLSWEEVDLPRGFIEVKATKSKTAARRLVTIQANLQRWLLPFRQSSGPVSPTNFQVRAKEDRDHAELGRPWPNNALRHSFASYHLAAFKDAAKLALEVGLEGRHSVRRDGSRKLHRNMIDQHLIVARRRCVKLPFAFHRLAGTRSRNFVERFAGCRQVRAHRKHQARSGVAG
jgi:integrase